MSSSARPASTVTLIKHKRIIRNVQNIAFLLKMLSRTAGSAPKDAQQATQHTAQNSTRQVLKPGNTAVSTMLLLSLFRGQSI
jgi:GTP cyclohydrolase III